MSDDTDDYEVGFGRPPKKHRFKPGVSGNPKGRPRKSPVTELDIAAELDGPRPAKLNGKPVKMSPKEMELRTMINDALRNNKVTSLIYVLRQFDKYGALPQSAPKGGGVVTLPAGMPSEMGMILITRYRAPYSKEDIAEAAEIYKAQRCEEQRLLDEHMGYPALRT